MKQIVFIAFVFIMAQSVTAQVTVRNDFVISGKEKKIRNKGVTFISINPAQRHGWNYLLNVRGVVIDVSAIRNPRKKYSYSQLAEKVYTPVPTGTNTFYAVPLFLLMPPPQLLPLNQRRQFFDIEI